MRSSSLRPGLNFGILSSSIPCNSWGSFSTASSEDKKQEIIHAEHQDASTSSSNWSYEQALAELPEGSQIHLDFFGEPVTFLGAAHHKKKEIANAVAALDGFEIGVLSKGRAFTGGGEEDGLEIQAAHSAAIAWSELLRHAAIWNPNELPVTVEEADNTTSITAAPMLIYVAIAPMIAQTGVGYVGFVDHLLGQVNSGVEGLPPIQLMKLAKIAVSMKDHVHLNAREQTHLLALDCMLRHDHRRALMILLRHLQLCPGDALALSVAMDLAHTVGDRNAALRAAGSVASYWNERRGTYLRPGLPGHSTTTALVALGLAVGGRHSEAEQLATFAMDSGKKVSGGIATWAMAHIFDAQGRTAEGISACANSDGTRRFEDCGLMFFDSILGGYGVRFALDREERGRGKSAALRLYDNNYERVLDYSGFAARKVWPKPMRKAPYGWVRSKFENNSSSKDSPKSFMKNLFGGGSEGSKETKADGQDDGENDSGEVIVKKASLPSLHRHGDWVPSCEDVFTWLPPTPQFLSDATMLLLRLTLNGTISAKNYRWEHIRNAWSVMFDIQQQYAADQPTLDFYPLASVTASLMATPEQAGSVSGPAGRLAEGLHKMSELLDLGDIVAAAAINDESDEGDDGTEGSNYLSTILFKEIVADSHPDFWLPVTEGDKREEWQTVLNLLSSAIDGVYHPTVGPVVDPEFAVLGKEFESWEFDVRPVLEHAVVYAACKCGDDESLSLARSICSRAVTLRPNCPEEWWRYSIVLGLLGDEVASEDALAASIAFGGGQGVRGE